MSRKDRHQSTENNETQEPWEQPIYDTDDEVSSRSSQRQQKKYIISFAIFDFTGLMYRYSSRCLFLDQKWIKQQCNSSNFF